jgi:hypothetical protein
MCAVDVLVSDPNADFGGSNRGAAYVLFLFPNGTVKDFVVLVSSASAFSTAFPPNGLSFASEYHRWACALFHSVVTRHTIVRILHRTPIMCRSAASPSCELAHWCALPPSDCVSVGSTPRSPPLPSPRPPPPSTTIHHHHALLKQVPIGGPGFCMSILVFGLIRWASNALARSGLRERGGAGGGYRGTARDSICRHPRPWLRVHCCRCPGSLCGRSLRQQRVRTL